MRLIKIIIFCYILNGSVNQGGRLKSGQTKNQDNTTQEDKNFKTKGNQQVIEVEGNLIDKPPPQVKKALFHNSRLEKLTAKMGAMKTKIKDQIIIENNLQDRVQSLNDSDSSSNEYVQQNQFNQTTESNNQFKMNLNHNQNDTNIEIEEQQVQPKNELELKIDTKKLFEYKDVKKDITPNKSEELGLENVKDKDLRTHIINNNSLDPVQLFNDGLQSEFNLQNPIDSNIKPSNLFNLDNESLVQNEFESQIDTKSVNGKKTLQKYKDIEQNIISDKSENFNLENKYNENRFLRTKQGKAQVIIDNNKQDHVQFQNNRLQSEVDQQKNIINRSILPNNSLKQTQSQNQNNFDQKIEVTQIMLQDPTIQFDQENKENSQNYLQQFSNDHLYDENEQKETLHFEIQNSSKSPQIIDDKREPTTDFIQTHQYTDDDLVVYDNHLSEYNNVSVISITSDKSEKSDNQFKKQDQSTEVHIQQTNLLQQDNYFNKNESDIPLIKHFVLQDINVNVPNEDFLIIDDDTNYSLADTQASNDLQMNQSINQTPANEFNHIHDIQNIKEFEENTFSNQATFSQKLDKIREDIDFSYNRQNDKLKQIQPNQDRNETQFTQYLEQANLQGQQKIQRQSLMSDFHHQQNDFALVNRNHNNLDYDGIKLGISSGESIQSDIQAKNGDQFFNLIDKKLDHLEQNEQNEKQDELLDNGIKFYNRQYNDIVLFNMTKKDKTIKFGQNDQKHQERQEYYENTTQKFKIIDPLFEEYDTNIHQTERIIYQVQAPLHQELDNMNQELNFSQNYSKNTVEIQNIGLFSENLIQQKFDEQTDQIGRINLDDQQSIINRNDQTYLDQVIDTYDQFEGIQSEPKLIQSKIDIVQYRNEFDLEGGQERTKNINSSNQVQIESLKGSFIQHLEDIPVKQTSIKDDRVISEDLGNQLKQTSKSQYTSNNMIDEMSTLNDDKLETQILQHSDHLQKLKLESNQVVNSEILINPFVQKKDIEDLYQIDKIKTDKPHQKNKRKSNTLIKNKIITNHSRKKKVQNHDKVIYGDVKGLIKPKQIMLTLDQMMDTDLDIFLPDNKPIKTHQEEKSNIIAEISIDSVIKKENPIQTTMQADQIQAMKDPLEVMRINCAFNTQTQSLCSLCQSEFIFQVNDQSWYQLGIAFGFRQQFRQILQLWRQIFSYEDFVISLNNNEVCFGIYDFRQEKRIDLILMAFNKQNVRHPMIEIPRSAQIDLFQVKIDMDNIKLQPINFTLSIPQRQISSQFHKSQQSLLFSNQDIFCFSGGQLMLPQLSFELNFTMLHPSSTIEQLRIQFSDTQTKSMLSQFITSQFQVLDAVEYMLNLQVSDLDNELELIFDLEYIN